MRSTILSTLLGVCLVAGGGTTTSAQPRIVNGSVTTRAVGGSLATELPALAAQDHGVVWVGWAVPANKAGQGACCHRDRGNVPASTCCSIERDDEHVVRTAADTGKARLEPSPDLGVYIRFEAGTFSRAAAYSLDCEIDAGGQRVVWLGRAKPAESIAWLASQATAPSDGGRGHDGLLGAVAFHADGEADRVLEHMALSATDRKQQQSAVFWMGAARGAAGFAGLQRAFGQLSDEKVREQVVFAVFVSKEPRSLDMLLNVARTDRQAHVRGQALFWLAQKAGARVTDTIVGALRDDPDTEVKKRAVFALSQLPKDEGVPRLIDVARTNRNPDVRKQAMFWLGQSKDARALAFFEQVLTGK